ncbi:biogenesis of lysosome-related organelles complex 1 subunit 4-like [Pelodytes ibericus]
MDIDTNAGHADPLYDETGAGSMGSPGDSGYVSQSHSVCSGASAGLLMEDDEDGALVKHHDSLSLADYHINTTATNFSNYVLQGDQKTEIESLEKCLEDVLIRVDEFVGMLDMIRNDTTQVVNEKVPDIYTKAVEMRKLYNKIDLLEAFVKKVGGNVSLMEEQVTQAETQLGTFPNTFKKIFQNISASPLFSPTKQSSASRAPQARYEPPTVFKTEDHFPTSS